VLTGNVLAVVKVLHHAQLANTPVPRAAVGNDLHELILGFHLYGFDRHVKILLLY